MSMSSLQYTIFSFQEYVFSCVKLKPISAISPKILTPKLQFASQHTEQSGMDMERWLTPLENFYIQKTLYPEE